MPTLYGRFSIGPYTQLCNNLWATELAGGAAKEMFNGKQENSRDREKAKKKKGKTLYIIIVAVRNNTELRAQNRKYVSM